MPTSNFVPPIAEATTCVAAAFAGWIVPVPPVLMRNGVAALAASVGSPVLTIAALMSATLQDGCAWRTSAAAPEVCGAAIEVPERIVAPLPVPLAVDEIDTPGAVTSGL